MWRRLRTPALLRHHVSRARRLPPVRGSGCKRFGGCRRFCSTYITDLQYFTNFNRVFSRYGVNFTFKCFWCIRRTCIFWKERGLGLRHFFFSHFFLVYIKHVAYRQCVEAADFTPLTLPKPYFAEFITHVSLLLGKLKFSICFWCI